MPQLDRPHPEPDQPRPGSDQLTATPDQPAVDADEHAPADESGSPDDESGSPDRTRVSAVRRLAALLVIRLNLTISYLYAAAASAVGADVLLTLLGVGAGWPLALPFMLAALAALGWWRQSRRGRRAPNDLAQSEDG